MKSSICERCFRIVPISVTEDLPRLQNLRLVPFLRVLSQVKSWGRRHFVIFIPLATRGSFAFLSSYPIITA